MQSLMWIAGIPVAVILLSLVLTGSALRKAMAGLCWAQVAMLLCLLSSVLTGVLPVLQFGPDFSIDRLSAAFVMLTTVVVACAVTHADCYFAGDQERSGKSVDCRLFYACCGAFLLSMTFVFIANNLGWLWICIEATTLSSAPLVYFERTKHAVEAAWKYLIICSVGIAFALLGTMLIFASSQQPGADGSLNITTLMQQAPTLYYPMLRLGFIFCLLGYGTKAGIFPLHNWLPDAHSEAPAPASAMLSAALLNCALFGVYRTSQIVNAANHSHLTYSLLGTLGALTVVAASILLIRQVSFKRLWAYSSIENVGIMVIAIGLGSGPLFFLQAVNHSAAKTALFLLTGNITQAAGSKKLKDLRGVIQSSPLWGTLLALAALAVSGVPPFGAFVSELAILTAGADPLHWPTAVALIIGVSISFIAICLHVGRVLAGTPRPGFQPYAVVRASAVPILLLAGSLLLGIAIKPEYWIALQ